MSIERSRAFAPISVPEAYDRYMSRQVFEPWARELLARADLRPGASVLDVATGPGTVARAAAGLVGEGGRVVASDLSPAMLAVASNKPPEPGAAPISWLEFPAGRIDAVQESFDRVLCQQGFQFFPDRIAALREFRRVLVPGGAAVIAVWAAERPLAVFGPIAEVLRDCGLPEPFPRAFDVTSYALGAAELRELLTTAGLREVTVETVELECGWDSGEDVVRAVSGTPFGPGLAAFGEPGRESALAALRERLAVAEGEPISFQTAANIARGLR